MPLFLFILYYYCFYDMVGGKGNPILLTTDEIWFVPAARPCITHIEIGNECGRMFDTNQLEFPICVDNLAMLNDYSFDETVRLISDGAANEKWLQPEQFWNRLSSVQLINFQGHFNQQTLNTVLSKCEGAYRLSFTYWRVESAVKMIHSLTSPHLFELTIDVGGTQSNPEDVFAALQAYGSRSNPMMKRLMLIFNDPLTRDPVLQHNLFARFAQLFDEGGDICLFYYEGEQCMYKLLEGYSDFGMVQMAENNSGCRDESEDKNVDQYRVFLKIEGNFSFYVCCRKGGRRIECSASKNFTTTRDGEKANCIKPLGKLECAAYRISHDVFSLPDYLSNDELAEGVNANNLDYGGIPFAESRSWPCCTIEGPCKPTSAQFNAPFFAETLIRATILFERQTHYFTSNGIYFLLTEMRFERPFMKWMDGRCTERFTFRCTSHERRYVVTAGMAEFFRNVENVEFVGNWYSPPLEPIMEHLPKNIKSIALMNVKLARKPLIHLTAAFKRGILPLDGFFYDSRDTIEMSLASIFHGMSNDNSKIQNLSNIVLIARSVSDPSPHGYRTTIFQFLDDLVLVTQEGATITVIVCDENVKASVLLNQGFADNGNVIVPAMFSNRINTANIFQFMKCFAIIAANRTFYVIIPNM